MAKSKNHTAHNQTYKAHRTPIKKPKTFKYKTRKGVRSLICSVEASLASVPCHDLLHILQTLPRSICNSFFAHISVSKCEVCADGAQVLEKPGVQVFLLRLNPPAGGDSQLLIVYRNCKF